MNFDQRETIIVACMVLFLGKYLNKRIHFLRNYNIPEPVTGGLLFSVLFGVIYFITGHETSFVLELRDSLLIVFFITIGLYSRLNVLKKGGIALIILLVLAGTYLFIQNFTGIGITKALGMNPILGILGGSVSFSGGHGTAIAWTPIFQNQYGVSNAAEIGIACATFGLVLGGIIGGPIAKFLVKRYRLEPKKASPTTVGVAHESKKIKIDYENALKIIFLMCFTAGTGIGINKLLVVIGLSLPAFVTALFAGIIVTNLAPYVFKKEKWEPENLNILSLISDLSLGLFLAMSLMSLELWTLVDLAGPLLLIVFGQALVITLFTIFVVFRLMGKDYDAAVICSGYAGLALGATPTAIANMTAVTKKLGGSAKAFIVVPLVGAFFIDIFNALIIKYLLGFA
ncbi:MAG: sodium/glutamate symporter [Bacteroidota bacterium]